MPFICAAHSKYQLQNIHVCGVMLCLRVLLPLASHFRGHAAERERIRSSTSRVRRSTRPTKCGECWGAAPAPLLDGKPGSPVPIFQIFVARLLLLQDILKQ